MKRLAVLGIVNVLLIQFTWAQKKMISGQVKTDKQKVLSGVSVRVKDTDRRTQTDFDGHFTIKANTGERLVFSFIGFDKKTITVGAATQLAVVMTRNLSLDEIVVLGSRAGARSRMESTVPVDAFDMNELSGLLPQNSLNQVLNTLVPSYTSSTHSGMNLTDHVDPAQIRGMSPDQTLVLLNGKRRHSSSLIHVTGGTANGSSGTDMNAIPSFALSKIEVLRDGASAQYGSDAIAGVVNLEMKRNTDGLSGQISYGGHLTDKANDQQGYWDGNQVDVDLNYGLKLGNKGGFINLTGSFQYRGHTSRAKDRQGQLFDAYNAVEERAHEAGVDFNSFYDNIGQLSGTEAAQFVQKIKSYGQEVDYFDAEFQNSLQNASSIADLQNLLSADVTDRELKYRGLERRDFNMEFGQSKTNNSQFFVNAEIPLNEHWKFYGFGGYSYRYGSAGGFNRKPYEANTITSLYPDGVLPYIDTEIHDFSGAVGIRGDWGEWEFDWSNVIGQNAVTIANDKSVNASLRAQSPTKIKSGKFRFLQNTMNIDLNRDFNAFEGLNMAFGVEYRYENYAIKAGQEESYAAYDIDGNVVAPGTLDKNRPTDFFGEQLEGGAQGFGGFKPANNVNEGRHSFAVYADASIDFTDWFLADGAVRYEHYSDFGSTVNFKLAARIKLSHDLNFRFAGSTGFRAPSMAQTYYNSTSGLITNDVSQTTGTFRNDSEVAQLMGIPSLKEEKSRSISAGLTYRIPSLNLNITADGFWTQVKDRIILTGNFAVPTGDDLSEKQDRVKDILETRNIEVAKFFANAIDTETRGLDIVISHKYTQGTHLKIKNDFGLNLNKTIRVGEIHSSDLLRGAGLEGAYFDEHSKNYLEKSAPRFKMSLSNLIRLDKFDFYVQNNYFGSTSGADNINVLDPSLPYVHQAYSGRVITNLSVGYNFSEKLNLTLGADNLFDVYPSEVAEVLNFENQFLYDVRVTHFGYQGRYVFARLNFKL